MDDTARIQAEVDELAKNNQLSYFNGEFSDDGRESRFLTEAAKLYKKKMLNYIAMTRAQAWVFWVRHGGKTPDGSNDEIKSNSNSSTGSQL